MNKNIDTIESILNETKTKLDDCIKNLDEDQFDEYQYQLKSDRSFDCCEKVQTLTERVEALNLALKIMKFTNKIKILLQTI